MLEVNIRGDVIVRFWDDKEEDELDPSSDSSDCAGLDGVANEPRQDALAPSRKRAFASPMELLKCSG